FFIGLAIPVMAQDTLLINYQGKLTNSSGDPLTGNYDITLKLYAYQTGPFALWSETHGNVPVSNGLLSLTIGSQTALPDSILNGTSRYLGITVGTDPEISPRTLLTSSPRAAVAGKVFGDLVTTNRSLMMKNLDGDSGIVLSTHDLGGLFRMFDSRPLMASRPIVEISSSNLGPSFALFDPESDPPGKRFEIMATSGSGPSMSFFNHAGEVMGVEPSPFNTGISWVFFDPQPEPPGKMFEITTIFETKGNETAMNFYSTPVGGANQELITLSAIGNDTEMRMGLGAPAGSSSSYISLKSDASGSVVEVIGPDAFTPGSPIVLRSDPAGGAMVGIGTNSPTQALHVVGNICYTGSIGACSDVAFKKDIVPIDNALSTVDHITGVKYSWRTNEYPERHFGSDRQIGLIAQEVKEVLPEAVTLQSDGYYSIDYSRLTPLLLEAIKELKKQNDDLTKRLEILEAQAR
ncbi:MAG: tail fiber domain-containing protein, partial [Candidatus Zixiibacteriota bacterium]